MTWRVSAVNAELVSEAFAGETFDVVEIDFVGGACQAVAGIGLRVLAALALGPEECIPDGTSGAEVYGSGPGDCALGVLDEGISGGRVSDMSDRALMSFYINPLFLSKKIIKKGRKIFNPYNNSPASETESTTASIWTGVAITGIYMVRKQMKAENVESIIQYLL